MAKRLYKVTVYRGYDDQWYWHLKAPNGKIVADSSEGYRSKAAATKMIKKIWPNDEVKIVVWPGRVIKDS